MGKYRDYGPQKGGAHLTTEGFKEAIDELYRMVGNAESRAVIDRALKAAAVPIRDKIIENIERGGHVWSGRLITSISVGRTIGVRKSGYRIKIGSMGQMAPHAHLVEFGHGGPKPAAPHPFVQPAYDTTKDEAYAILKEQLKAALFEHNANTTSDVWAPSV